MKTKWTKSVPREEGWYWVRYGGKHGTVISPARILHFEKGEPPRFWRTAITSAMGDFFSSENLEDLEFGPAIPAPD